MCVCQKRKQYMAISNLWEIVKADRYTADGREAIAKAREADVEDRTYQIGEISQKTGLQKTAEGWVTPKGKANAAIEAKGKSENKSDKWEKNKDYLNRERISMKTPSGGSVSIYESENPNQKNNRFRVDTGDHYNNFNTLEEAKAFAEKEYGGNSAVGAKKEKAETSFGKVVQENGKWGVRTKMGSRSSFMPAESEADAMEALKNLTEGFESVGGNKYTFKKSEATKAQEAYEKNQKKIASENKKRNSLENAKKMAESYRKTSNKPIYITEKDGDYVVAKGRDELEYARENGYKLVPSTPYPNRKLLSKISSNEDSAPRQLTGDCKITIKG